MTATMPKISFPVPSNKNGHPFSSAEELLSVLGGESSGLYLVGSQGMWHGGIHFTEATIPWCALSTDSEAESEYCREPFKGEQFIRCMADGEIVAWRVCESYESAGIDWRGEKLLLSNAFVLVKHYIQPGDSAESGLTFFTLYMNLVPYDAYKQQGNPLDRKTGGVLRYYSSADDIQAERVAGKLDKDTPVTLSGNIVTRSKDQRQFTEVTITRETRNAAGEMLAAGTKVWTVSDQGNLKTAESASVPSWWAKCSPAYTAQPEGVVNCTSRTDWAYYLSREDVLQYKNPGRLVAGFPLSYAPGDTAQQVTRPGRNLGEAARTFSLVTLGRDKDKLKKGDRVWVVSDSDSLTPVAPAASGGEPKFDTVYVPPVAVPVSAGDSLGHMGFYQLPEENGKRSRYQVHIECLSMDDMEKFITNPGRAGVDAPVYLTWKTDTPLSEKGEQGMVAGSRKTKTSGILTLAKVPGADAEGNALTNNRDAAYFQIRPEGGWLPAASVQKVSQYALGELGFVTLDKAPASFDLIDGIKQPNNVVKGILDQLYKAAQEETRTTHALNKYNYKRLLELIDRNEDGYYPEQEYLQAIHNVSYRDHLYRVIAKHASEWYYGKDDPLWKTYLDTLTKDAPTWKTYLGTFLDKMTWMKAVSEKGVVLGAEPWHMHPVLFLDALESHSSHKKRDYDLGSLSSKYETGGRGSQTVSGGQGDAGGVSYGSYQMTSKTTKRIHGQLQSVIGGTVKIFISDSSFKWKNEFNGLIPGSPSFTSKWKELVKNNPTEFKIIEHEFIKKTHFDKLVEHTLTESGVDIPYHSHTLNDVVWSTAVQHGPQNNIIINAIKAVCEDASETKNYDEILISEIYDERGKRKSDGNLVYFSKNSASVQVGVSERFISEKKEALERLSNEKDY